MITFFVNIPIGLNQRTETPQVMREPSLLLCRNMPLRLNFTIPTPYIHLIITQRIKLSSINDICDH